MSEQDIVPEIIEKSYPLNWSQIKQNIMLYMKSELRIGQSTEIYNLGHAGREFEDFQLTGIPIKEKGDEINAEEFFLHIADTIINFVLRRIENDVVPSEIRAFFSDLANKDMDDGSGLVAPDDFSDFFYKYTDEIKMTDSKVAIKILSMDITKLFTFLYIAKILRLRISQGFVKDMIVNLDNVHNQSDSWRDWLRKNE